MKQSILFILFISLFSFEVCAESKKNDLSSSATQSQAMVVTHALKGKVIDEHTHEALAGVLVMVNGEKVYTDFDGNFLISDLSGSNCKLMINYISYQEKVISIDPTRATDLEIKLQQR